MSALAVDDVRQSPPTPADAARVLGLIGGYQVSQAIYAAAELKLADLIAAGVVSSDELAEHAAAVPDRVHRLLRSLACHGLFTQTGPRTWELTPAGHTLRSDVPGSLHAMAVMWNEEHYDAFRSLVDAVRSERPAFDQRFGTDWWTYLGEHPESSAKFNAAMGSIGKKVHAAAVAAADLSRERHLVDVGGGAGGLTAAFLARYPELRATILDLPHVLPGAEEMLPAGGDAYLLSMIIHDWTDEQAGRLLQTIRRAIPDTGRLLIIDAVLPPGDEPHFGKLLDLTMMAMLTGRERSQAEFAALLDGAGFRLVEVSQMAAPTSLIEARPA